MARRFRVTIGGVTYNVDVEEVGAPAGAPAAAPAYAPAPSYAPAPTYSPAPAAPAPAPVAAPAPAPAPAAAPVGDGQKVAAPLPGLIVGVKVEVGQAVKAGDVLLVLEAMKMENDITSPYSGTVKQILVAKGSSVSLNDPLVVIG